FDAYGGQIVGIGGLVGSGRTELLRSIYGADSYDGGSVLLNGKPVSHNVQKNIRAGIGLIPEDRRVEGFIPALSVEQNIALPNYDMLQILRGFIDHKSVKKTCADMIAQIDIRPPVPGMRVLNLSGGNQQKVVVGKWLARDLNVLLVDEPTVGVDVGVKSEIYGIFRRLADRGTIVIVVSSDIKELISISDRILIFHGGRIAREFSRGNVTQKEILLAASGITAEESKAI
ncbi:MAG TPA: ATP-binding cassette domain-containing protein, partial [Oscillospiraceae bacterium]|nr:ATP-binding cassette domain-containing protein [Oscillospiraceae bacterium]